MICPPCVRASRRRGRHRAHDCAGGGVTRYMGWTCDCRCQREMLDRIMRNGGFPSMRVPDELGSPQPLQGTATDRLAVHGSWGGFFAFEP